MTAAPTIARATALAELRQRHHALAKAVAERRELSLELAKSLARLQRDPAFRELVAHYAAKEAA